MIAYKFKRDVTRISKLADIAECSFVGSIS